MTYAFPHFLPTISFRSSLPTKIIIGGEPVCSREEDAGTEVKINKESKCKIGRKEEIFLKIYLILAGTLWNISSSFSFHRGGN